MPTFDSVNLTALSESSPRTSSIDRLQIHHATTTSLAGLRDLMDPGGRQVSANGAMGNTGHLMHVVDWRSRRAFTSGVPSQDQRAFTVEVCNTTLGPEWGISIDSHRRLAILAAELHLEVGLPLDRAHVIGHREVPGTYATACPGPSMDLDFVVRDAARRLAPIRRKGNSDMYGYIWDGKRYALINPIHIKDGALVTTDINEANSYSITNLASGGSGAPQQYSAALFDAEIAFAKRLYDMAKAERATVNVGEVKVGQVTLDPASIKSLATATAVAVADEQAKRLGNG